MNENRAAAFKAIAEQLKELEDRAKELKSEELVTFLSLARQRALYLANK